MEGASAGDPPWGDLPPVGDVFLQDLDGLVVDAADIPLAEAAELLLRREIFPVAAFFGTIFARHVTSPRGLRRPESPRPRRAGPRRRAGPSSSAGRGRARPCGPSGSG